jgi:glycosyltransferase involved in cell wall biosynthesis
MKFVNRIAGKLRALLPPSLNFWLKFKRAKVIARLRKDPQQDSFKHPTVTRTTTAPNRSERSIIVFDDHLPTPDRDAGGVRMSLILKSLVKLGPTVFISLGTLRQPDYERLLAQAGVEVVFWLDYERLLKERGFHVALLSRPDVAGALLPSVKKADPRIKTIFDTVDLAFVRLEREYQLTGDEKVAQKARYYRKLETRLAGSCDQVWCVTTEDQRILAQEVPSAKFEIIPTIHALQDRGQEFAKRHGLLFIGNFLHRPNVDAVHYFMREIDPLVRKSIPDIKVFIVGEHAPPEIVAYSSQHVSITGYVPDVDPIFHGCRIFIAPLRFGSGMKGKIGQALSYGLPVVTTSVGAEGMGLKGECEVIIGNTPRELAMGLIRVYEDADLWLRLSDNGYNHIAQHYTPQVLEENIHQAIKNICGLDETHG